MTNSISLGQAQTPSPQSVQLRKHLDAAHMLADRRAKKGKDSKFICVSLCDLHDPHATGLRPGGVAGRIASAKHILQPAVPQFGEILQLLIRLLFSRLNEFMPCPYISDLSEDDRIELPGLVIDEIVKIYDQVSRGVVTDYTLADDCLCNDMCYFRKQVTNCPQWQFTTILKDYGMHSSDQRYISMFERHEPGRYNILPDHVRPLIIYFLIDPRWRIARQHFLMSLRRHQIRVSR